MINKKFLSIFLFLSLSTFSQLFCASYEALSICELSPSGVSNRMDDVSAGSHSQCHICELSPGPGRVSRKRKMGDRDDDTAFGFQAPKGEIVSAGRAFLFEP